MNKAIVPVAIGAGLIYFLAKGYNTVKAAGNLQYLNPRIKLGKIGLTRVELQMTIDLQNTGSANIPLQYFTGNINYLLNNVPKKLSSFTFNPSATTATSIKARATTTVPFTVVISNLSAISTLVQIVKSLTTPGNKLGTVIQVDGSMYAAGVDIPVKFNYDIKNNAVAGIGTVKASLEFGSNTEMEKYFTGKRADKKIMFSKN
jgi:hypothetical protein